MATADYGITPFLLEMPGNDRRASVEESGHLIIRASQSSLSPPASFKVRARFVNADRSAATPAIVIGYNELQLRALDQASFPILSRYPMVDLQIPKIIGEARTSLPELSPNDLDDFQNCLVCLGAYSGMVQQTGVFTGRKVDEKREFQQHLLQYLRGRLGEDVREEETLAGGRPDLRYRRIVIELKVEEHDQGSGYSQEEIYGTAHSVCSTVDSPGCRLHPRHDGEGSPALEYRQQYHLGNPDRPRIRELPSPVPYENRGCDHRRQSEAT